MVDTDFENLVRENHKEQLYLKSNIELDYKIEEVGVKSFIVKYPYLISLLAEAREKIREVWGKGIDVSLSLSYDPECGGEPDLYAGILTPLDAKESRARMREFDHTWWLANLRRTQGKFLIGMDYI